MADAMPPPSSGFAAESRLMSLDALRGFDMFWILGADGVVMALGKISDAAPIRLLVRQVDHSAWAGLTFYDLIFPLFVFITGVSLVFSIGKSLERRGRAVTVRRILKRTLVLFVLGILYNGGLSHEWPNVRLMGVLQRIALAYGTAALLFCFFKRSTLWITGGLFLVFYWAILTFIPIRAIALEKNVIASRVGSEHPTVEQVRRLYDDTATMVTGRYDPGLNVANHFDFRWLPGAKYDVYWDPEGPLSTLPAIATCLLGVMAGGWLRRSDLDERKKIQRLLVAGGLCLVLGYAWSFQFPIVKKIWTSSFMLVAGGWSVLLLAAFYYVVDVRKWRRWCRPFVWIGLNPITLYLATALVDFDRIARHFAGGSVARFIDLHFAPGMGELLVAALTLALLVGLAGFLCRKGIFLRI
ncbi:MAG TPA: heparan-alpha-glucosaminide N-acetyltransferase domain-containing protein [Lacunisphaera sp.]|jgi:predicted acyltransferase